MVIFWQSCFAQNIRKKMKMRVCSGILNNIFDVAGRSDGAFVKISGVKQLCQGLLFCWPQIDNTGDRILDATNNYTCSHSWNTYIHTRRCMKPTLVPLWSRPTRRQHRTSCWSKHRRCEMFVDESLSIPRCWSSIGKCTRRSRNGPRWSTYEG